MLYEGLSSQDIFNLVKELLASIRDCNRRLGELKWVLKTGKCNKELEQEIKEKIWSIQETKFCLIYSMFDVRTSLIRALSINRSEEDKMASIFKIERLYEELKCL